MGISGACGRTGQPIQPCWGCDPRVWSPQDSGGVSGDVPRWECLLWAAHIPMETPSYGGTARARQGAWTFSSDEHPSSEAYSMVVEHEQGWKL